MKILVLSSLAYSLVNFRGALIARMLAQGHSVVAVAPDEDTAAAEALSRLGVPLKIVPMARTGTDPLQDLITLRAYMRLLRQERPDLVFAYTQKPIIYGGIATRLYGRARFFALMSGLGYVFSEEAAKRRLLRAMFCRLYRAGLARAEMLFVFNRDDRGDMIDAGVIGPDQPVLQVPGSGIDIARFPAVPLPKGPPVFLMVSRLMRDKGVYEFLSAARIVRASYPDARFQLLGRTEDSNSTGITSGEVERLAREYPVEFLGETRDVRPFLAAASVFVLPSFYREGLPRTILEAMATGRSIITTDMPGCRDPIEPEGNGLLVQPRSAESLASAMLRMIEEDGLAARMGTRSRQLAEAVYDVDKVNRLLMRTMGLELDAYASEDCRATVRAPSVRTGASVSAGALS